MSYNTKTDEIEIEGVVYEIERETDHRIAGETLYVIDPDADDDEETAFGPRMEGIYATLGYEQDGCEFANPRDWSNVGLMVCDYRGYLLGDQDGPSLAELQDHCDDCERCERTGYVSVDDLTPDEAENAGEPDEDGEVTCPTCEGQGEIEIDIIDYIRKEYGARVILPLYVYEHSGITMRSGMPIGPKLTREDVRSSGRFMGDDAGWDTSTVGFTFDTPEKVKECIGDNATDEQIQKALEGEVEVYARYLEGDVTYYQVFDEETGYNEGCGGFVGDHDECERQCFSDLEGALVKRLAENRERNYWIEREVLTVG